jgi:hypothetical protein
MTNQKRNVYTILAGKFLGDQGYGKLKLTLEELHRILGTGSKTFIAVLSLKVLKEKKKT